MRAIDAQALLNDLEQQVEKQLAEVVRTYQNMSSEILLRKPADGGWSVAECLWHLNSYGVHYLPRIAKGLAATTASSSHFRSSWLGAWFTRLMKPGPKMTKLRAFKNHIPSGIQDPHAVVAEFIRQQEELLGLLRRAQHADLNAVRVDLSIAAWFTMKLGDVFQFLVAHQERHLVQARRVIG